MKKPIPLPIGFKSWLDYAIACFDQLYREGVDEPRMMSLGLHLRIIGRPGRIAAFEKFLQHASAKADVWFATRLGIAQHFAKQIPAGGTN